MHRNKPGMHWDKKKVLWTLVASLISLLMWFAAFVMLDVAFFAGRAL